MGLVYAFVTVVMHAEQGISGIGIFLFGLGFTDLLFQKQVGTPVPIDGLGKGRSRCSATSPRSARSSSNTTCSSTSPSLLVPVVSFVINRTTFGLNVRAVGETPEAADTLGVSVNGTRVATIVIGNTFAGLAGAALALEVGSLPAEPHRRSGLHRHRSRLLRRVAPDRRDGWCAAVRHRVGNRAAVEDARHRRRCRIEPARPWPRPC